MMDIGSMQWKDLIRDGAKTFDIHLDQEAVDHFAIHAIELIKWNRKTNLTAITDPMAVAVKHFIDSMAPIAELSSPASLLDIGSGGGFPGVPLKIVIPTLSVTLIDSSRKKVNFLKHLIRTLQLTDINVYQTRAENVAIGKLSEDIQTANFLLNSFDIVICRALTSLDGFIRLALPFLKQEGMMIALKGKASEKEIESVCLSISEENKGLQAGENILSWSIKKYGLPYLGSDRSMIMVRKKQCIR